jgi:quinol monooxygenase YgiN
MNDSPRLNWENMSVVEPAKKGRVVGIWASPITTYPQSRDLHFRRDSMTKFALFVRLEAKPGQEAAVAAFLSSALPLANAESETTAWFALQFGPSTFGVFDAFADEKGRQAHLRGPIAAALMANAAALLSAPPNIEMVDLLAAKLPGQ